MADVESPGSSCMPAFRKSPLELFTSELTKGENAQKNCVFLYCGHMCSTAVYWQYPYISILEVEEMRMCDKERAHFSGPKVIY